MGKRWTFLFLPLAAGLSGMAAAETCRSVSAAWQVGETAYTTRIWTTGDHGCKRIEHTITTPDGVETALEVKVGG